MHPSQWKIQSEKGFLLGKPQTIAPLVARSLRWGEGKGRATMFKILFFENSKKSISSDGHSDRNIQVEKEKEYKMYNSK